MTRRTTVHHHHDAVGPVVVAPRRRTVTQRRYYGSGDTSGGAVATAPYESEATIDGGTEFYLSLGGGLSAVAAPNLFEGTQAGVGAALTIGSKQGWMAGELTLQGATFSAPDNQLDSMSMFGVHADLKVQPSLFILEPFSSVGLGVQALDYDINESAALGASLRLGAGADIRVGDFAVTAQYTYSLHGFATDAIDQDGAGQSDMVSAGIKLYF